MNIDILCIGSIKEKYLREGIEEYAKRLRPYCRLKLWERPEEKIGLNPSRAEIDRALQKEAGDLVRFLPKQSKPVSLCIEGDQLSSEDFSRQMEKWFVEGGGRISFIIGSSHGLSPEIKGLGARLSFSRMTYPHQLMRLILLEQIYRAFRISLNEPYHK